ncbi:MAG: hypothetical protein JWQ02_336 [Capsulimonas sp.]|nr:hypothetical protein [Capsulimonas sp.]
MRRHTTVGISIALCALAPLGVLAKPASTKKTAGARKASSTLINFNASGLQTTRFDSVAAAIDAHDGKIAYFDGIFYLYGTSYDCGYEWGNKSAPFCGFKVYTSVDLVNWTDKGFLFDARTPLWQTRCNGATYGCYRPHVIYNKKTKQYVLWINVYDNSVGYRVFTSRTPVGPFLETAEPTLAVNHGAPVAGLNNGDHDTFVDDDGTAYLAYTDWRTGGSIAIEKLNADYTSGTGQHVKNVTPGQTEAPALLKHNGKYYVLYSDPNCGYCSGTGTSYRTAPNPLGPWSDGVRISDDSGGGQPSFVSTIKLGAKVIFLYGSDLWNDGAKNEALANFYWAPLTFSANGSINRIERQNKVSVAIRPETAPKASSPDLDNTSGVNGFTNYCDIGGNIQRAQSFVATRTGILNAVSFSTFKKGYPDAGLTMEIYKADTDFKPVGSAFSSILILPESIGWSPKYTTIHPNILVKSGVRYAIVVKSASTGGRYGCEYNDSAPYPGGGATYSSNGGGSFSVEQNRSLMFRTLIHK